MKIVGMEIFLEGTHFTLGSRVERLGVVPLHIDASDFEHLQLRVTLKPPKGGNLEMILDLNQARMIKDA